MLKTILRRYKDEGAIVLEDREIDVSYEISVSGNSNVRKADGHITGLDIVDYLELLESQQELRLRLKTGDVVDFIFVGGQLHGPARIVVNSAMPGLD